eukprot:TRINITY_DN2696_c0_g1_i3.p1 TRINITY_DN2696_c0_g1~~TRINITY_DN2696_c0_g1_i3.p1  ORF type:complete len:284 (-),score=59.56 TRINITY_DN2696_c0_g1_i3:145-996(-)
MSSGAPKPGSKFSWIATIILLALLVSWLSLYQSGALRPASKTVRKMTQREKMMAGEPSEEKFVDARLPSEAESKSPNTAAPVPKTAPNLFVYADVVGGLGNQLFITAAAASYAVRSEKHLVMDQRTEVRSSGKKRPTYRNSVFTKIRTREIELLESAVKVLTANQDMTPMANQNVKFCGTCNVYFQEMPPPFHQHRAQLLELFDPSPKIKEQAKDVIGAIGTGNAHRICIHHRFADRWTPQSHIAVSVDNQENRDKLHGLLLRLEEQHPSVAFVVFSLSLIHI